MPGSADRSYGIQVAKLAGLPASVIERAKLVLAKLEAGGPRRAEGLRGPAAVRGALQAARSSRRTTRSSWWSPPSPRSIPDEMSPREAMEALYMLKAKLAQTEKK